MGSGLVQDPALEDSAVVNLASFARKTFPQFGVPVLILFLVAPRELEWLKNSAWILALAGLPVALLGIGLRLWSRGFKRADGMVVDGPYRYVRNPVELGAVLGFTGAGIALGIQFWFLAVILFLAVAWMSFASLAAEREVFLIRGGAYLRFMRRVRRWIPTRYAATNRSNSAHSLTHALKFEKDTIVWLVGYAVVYAISYRWHL